MPENPPEFPIVSNGEASFFSFVIRLWKEDSAPEEQQTGWRGHITPVPDGQRHYFTSLSEIPKLIVAHLKLQK